MKFTPTWYKNPSFTGIPSFQELEDITGMAYDDKGNYIGPKEKPKMQMVLDQTTNRQYWAPEEYDDDAVKYGAARLNKEFNSKEWWGMLYNPHLTKTQKVSVAFLETLKQGGKFLAKAPTEMVAGVSGISDMLGINLPFDKAGPSVISVAKKIGEGKPIKDILVEGVGTLLSAFNPAAYFGSNLARKGIRASAEDFVDVIKSMKSPSGEMGDSARLYRASAQNWAETVDKYLPDVEDNIKANSTLVAIGSMAGQIGGSLLLAAGTSGVGGLPAVAGVFGSQQFYSLREEYLEKGYSLQSANIYAGLGALAEGGLEAVGFSHWLKYATLKPSLRNHLIAGFMEASQEATQTTAEEILTILSGVREETLTEILANISISAVAGFIPGAGLSAVSGGVGIRKEKAIYELDAAFEKMPAATQPKTPDTVPVPAKNAEQGRSEAQETTKRTDVKTELELAKANKGSNPVYDMVRNLANSYSITNDQFVDQLYAYAINEHVQGRVGEELLEGLGKQIVAYQQQLISPDKETDKENKQAALDITYHLSQEAVNKFRENTKAAAEKSGLSQEEAARIALSESKIYQHLSEEFGEDVQNVKKVEIMVPEATETQKLTLDEALTEAEAIDTQIERLAQIEGTERQISELQEEKNALLSRGQIELGETLNKITLTGLSDVTTIKHELMHHWSDIVDIMAARGNKKAKALKKAKDSIIAENREYVKQDKNKADEVLSEAYEAWLYTGVVAESPAEQKLFDAIKEYFQSVYESVRDITGIRVNPEIDQFFRQMTGMAPIEVKEDIFAPNTEAAAKFKEEATELLNNANADNKQTLSLGTIPPLYTRLGLPAQELKTNKLALRKALGQLTKEELQTHADWHNHNVPQEVVDNLPALIADPVAVMRSNTKNGNFVAVLDADVNGQPVIVVISPSEKESGYTLIPSAYERKNYSDFVRNTLKKRNVLYVDMKRASNPGALTQAALAGNKALIDSIKTKEDFVKRLNQKAYHGTPYRFERFSTEHIGTGEGVQVHGWGLYFAENKKEAQFYRGGKERKNLFYGGKPLWESELKNINPVDVEAFKKQGKKAVKSFIDEQKRLINVWEKQTQDVATKEAISQAKTDIEVAKNFDPNKLEERGQLVEANIPENDVLLDENKPFNEQPEKVKQALKEIAKEYGSDTLKDSIALNETGGSMYRAIVLDNENFLKEHNEPVSYSISAKNASESLLFAGVQGITFDMAGTTGYVIFDDKSIRINKILYQTIKAQQTGARAADSKPSKEQIAKDLNVLRTNGVQKYERKNRVFSGFGDWAKDIILSVRQRAEKIDPKIKAFFDKLDYFQPNLERKFASRANGWIEKYQKLTEEDKNELDYYIYNQLHEELDAFLKQKDMTKEYQDVRQLLNFIYSISNQADIDMRFIEEYFPTSMIDYAGFLDYMKGTDKWSTIEKDLKEADPKGIWSDKEKADAINKSLRGYSLDPAKKPKNAKERKILYKSPELMRFYEHSDVALIKYLQGMSQAIAINKAFGKGGGVDTDATIGGIVLDLINSGSITHKEEAEIKKLLKSRLSYRATPEFISMVKNVGYLQTMNNFTSAITQLGDLYAPFYKYSFGTALKSIFGENEINVQDLGLDKIWEEFSDSSKTGILVDKLFKVVGLERLDKFGKSVAINASLINLREQAQNGNIELLNRLSYTFGKDAQKVLGEIKEGKVTDDVKILIWSDLADTQPIGRSGVPTGYLDNPHGRLFYQLKTFTLNQLSLFYADSLVNMQKGIKYKNKTQFLKGVQNGFKLLLLLTAGNAAADVLKNIVMGREIDVSDTVVSNLLWNIGVSKYTFYKGKRDGYARAILSSYLMPPQLSVFDDTLIDARKIASGKRELKDTQAVTYLPFGRAYYWWFGGGRTSEKKKKKEKKNK